MTVPAISIELLSTSLKNKVNDLLESSFIALKAIQNKTCLSPELTGWYDYPQKKGFALLEDILKFKSQLAVSYDSVVVIGIGGSYLGCRAVESALNHTYGTLFNKERAQLIYIGHHISETCLREFLDHLETKLPLINIISKSGTTTEPQVTFRVLMQYLEKRFSTSELQQRIIVTTDAKKGALRELAALKKFKTFEVPGDMGGRFSVLSAVGLVPLTLNGIDTQALLKGADQIFSELNQLTMPNHSVLTYCCARAVMHQMNKQIEILAYKNPKLHYFCEWWKQLFGESEGKGHKGLFPAGACYTTDLHSLGQYLQDGKRNMLETFLDIPEHFSQRVRIAEQQGDIDGFNFVAGRHIDEINEAAWLATKLAHIDGGVECLEIKTVLLSAKTLGQLIAFFETACGISGSLINVNPYDQPGVEAYKNNLFALLGRAGYQSLG